MSYVTPNSTLQLFKGINLDNRYMHTIYFASETAQDSWFTSKVFKTFNDLMYRRYTSNQVKVEADATTLLGTTYMRFRNTRTGSKWFYAFVLSVDYINENTSVITYEIDVMQTWFIQAGSVNPCMVLREHVNDDTIFSNLEHEPVGSDVYEYEYLTDANTTRGGASTSSDTIFTDYSVVITTTGKSTTTGYYREGLFDGTKHDKVHCNSSTQSGNVVQKLDDLLGDWDTGNQEQEVLSMITFPSYFADLTYAEHLTPVSKTVNALNVFGGTAEQSYTDGYRPKNLKLFSYPYNYLYCTTHNGDSNMYRWEYFDNGEAYNRITDKTFEMIGSSVGAGQIKCYPLNYDGVDSNYECGVSMSDFPHNAFSYDAYQAWIAAGGKTRLQNEQSIVNARGITNIVSAGSDFINTTINSASDIYGTATGVSNTGRHITRRTGAKVSEISSSVNNAVQSAANLSNAIIDYVEAKNKIDYQWKDASYRPNEIVGSSEPNVMVGGRLLNFYFYNVHVKLSEITRIDDFFSCYGYAINKVKTPNLTGRQYWNFVQTKDCAISGDMPSSSKEAIGRIFDGGITFWHNGDQIGNYAQSVTNDSINNPII